MLFSLLFSTLHSVASAAFAQTAGYVVKAESGTVYLDQGAGAASVGQEFAVFTEGEELKHPKTGASLGRIENELALGRIVSVTPKYSVGRLLALDPNVMESDIKAGQSVRLLPLAPPAAAPAAAREPSAAPAAAPANVAAQGTRAPLWRSPAVDLEAVDMAAGDLLGDGKTEIILADERRVLAYPGAAADASAAWKPVCRYEAGDTGVKIVSVDAADLDRDGKAEVFVSDYNSFFNRVETTVLEYKDGAFVKTASLPWLTRAYQDAGGTWRLASQQLAEDKSFPFANIYDLRFSDGKYVQSGPALNLKRVEWLYGFAAAQDPAVGEPFHLYYAPSDSIRIQFQKGKWTSPDTYGQTASRILWFDRHLMFHPRLTTTQAAGTFTGVYALKNNPGLGGLAGAFGYYSSAELHRLRWTGMSLEPEWKADLGGYAADLVVARPDASSPEEVLVAVVGKGGKTSVWKFTP